MQAGHVKQNSVDGEVPLSGREVVPVQDAVNGHWSGRGTSITDLSW